MSCLMFLVALKHSRASKSRGARGDSPFNADAVATDEFGEQSSGIKCRSIDVQQQS